MSDNSLARVNYFDRQFLRTQDFVAEQAYHVGMRRRHNIAAHIWGIVTGLDVVVTDNRLIVQPGLAIDGYGRELVLSQGQPINRERFDQLGSDILEVWLTYDQVPAEPAPRGYVVRCNDNPPSQYRTQEVGRVDVRLPNRYVALDPDDDLSERRQPPGVPEADFIFNPARTPPDSPSQGWPVYLARVRRDLTQTSPYRVDMVGRPYAGLVGEAIIHPAERGEVQLDATSTSRAAQVHLGSEQPGDDDRFVVSLYDAAAQRRIRRLSIDDQGDLSLRGDTVVYGDVIVDGGAVEFRAGPAYAEPKPWRMYRVVGAQPLAAPAAPGGGPATGAPPLDTSASELRIELPAASPGSLNRVAIGKWSDKEKRFVPCLTVADDCSVTVHGNLVVTGTLTAPIVDQASLQNALAALFRSASEAKVSEVDVAKAMSGAINSQTTSADLLKALKTQLGCGP